MLILKHIKKVIIISVWKDCYLFRNNSGKIIIEYNNNEPPEGYKYFNPNDLCYNLDKDNNLVWVRDPEGNYYYLNENYQKIQE